VISNHLITNEIFEYKVKVSINSWTITVAT